MTSFFYFFFFLRLSPFFSVLGHPCAAPAKMTNEKHAHTTSGSSLSTHGASLSVVSVGVRKSELCSQSLIRSSSHLSSSTLAGSQSLNSPVWRHFKVPWGGGRQKKTWPYQQMYSRDSTLTLTLTVSSFFLFVFLYFICKGAATSTRSKSNTTGTTHFTQQPRSGE